MNRRIIILVVILAITSIYIMAIGCSNNTKTNDKIQSTIVIDGAVITDDLRSDPNLVPAAAIKEYFGAQIFWKEDISTLEITSPHKKYLSAFSEGVYSLVASDALDLVKSNKAVVLDIRSNALRDRGHIVDSLHIPIAEFFDRMNELPEDKAIVVYCKDNISATYAVYVLNIRGYEAYVLVGGMNSWITAGGETIFCAS